MTVSHPLIEPQHLRELAQVLAETGLAEVEIERPELRVRLSRQVVGAVAAAPVVAGAIPAVAASAAPAGAVAAPAAPAPVADTGVTVRSPLVGTAYGASSPQEAPFIEVGTVVTEGQTLLVVEAMKTLNHVVAPCAGVVREILFRDGEPVEYDQAVVLIDQG